MSGAYTFGSEECVCFSFIIYGCAYYWPSFFNGWSSKWIRGATDCTTWYVRTPSSHTSSTAPRQPQRRHRLLSKWIRGVIIQLASTLIWRYGAAELALALFWHFPLKQLAKLLLCFLARYVFFDERFFSICFLAGYFDCCLLLHALSNICLCFVLLLHADLIFWLVLRSIIAYQICHSIFSNSSLEWL